MTDFRTTPMRMALYFKVEGDVDDTVVSFPHRNPNVELEIIARGAPEGDPNYESADMVASKTVIVPTGVATFVCETDSDIPATEADVSQPNSGIIVFTADTEMTLVWTTHGNSASLATSSQTASVVLAPDVPFVSGSSSVSQISGSDVVDRMTGLIDEGGYSSESKYFYAYQTSGESAKIRVKALGSFGF